MSEIVSGVFAQLFPDIEVVHHPRLGVVSNGERAESAANAAPPLTVVPIVVDARVERMVKLAILSSSAVILVGAPGTGKTTLLRQVTDQILSDPGAHGFTHALPGLSWSTPQENWTTTDLVGGETVDEGLLRFRPGRVLDAIATGQWLVLDEANRADMDRIFGGLLTWLSGLEVDLGPVAPIVGGPHVMLGWANGATSTVENPERLQNPSPGDPPVRYLAGSEWRLLGTYNALDAQRVFRFGQAIGRRFVRVPIPAPSPEQFRAALLAQPRQLPPGLAEAVVGLYAAHRTLPATELGPALFLRIPDYVLAGRETQVEALSDAVVSPPVTSSDSASEGHDALVEQVQADNSESHIAESLSIADRELLVEAYLVNVGTWLRQLEEDLPALGRRVVNDHHCMSPVEWDWVVEMSRALG